MSSDPETALDAAERLARRARFNSEKVRATLTMGWAHRAAGRAEHLRDAIERASGYRRPGNIASSELEGASALYLLLAEADLRVDARRHAEAAVSLAKPSAELVPRPSGNWRGAALVESVVNCATYAAALIVRSHVRINLSDKAAMTDALEALRWADPRYVPHVHVAGVAATGVALLESGAATPAVCERVLRISGQAERMLDGRRVKAKTYHRLALRVLTGIAVALLGSVERAEAVITRAIKDLESIGRHRDAKIFGQQLVSILANRAAQEGRARLLARKYGGMLPPAAKRRPPDDDEPIGF